MPHILIISRGILSYLTLLSIHIFRHFIRETFPTENEPTIQELLESENESSDIDTEFLELVINHIEKDLDHDYSPLKHDPYEMAKKTIRTKVAQRTKDAEIRLLKKQNSLLKKGYIL